LQWLNSLDRFPNLAARKGAGRLKPKKETTLSLEQKLAKAFSHPTRVQLLAILNERSAAAVELVPEFQGQEHGLEGKDQALTHISYHLRVLARCDCLDVVRTEFVRGAKKTTYTARTRMMIDDAEWTNLGPEAQAGVTNFSLGVLVKQSREAVKAGTFDGRADSHLSTTTITLDEQGWRKLTGLLSNVLDAVKELEKEAESRDKTASERFRATVGILGFECPE
jgi:hypothetical protein